LLVTPFNAHCATTGKTDTGPLMTSTFFGSGIDSPVTTLKRTTVHGPLFPPTKVKRRGFMECDLVEGRIRAVQNAAMRAVIAAPPTNRRRVSAGAGFQASDPGNLG
jgi:hypothetical protein